METMMSSFTINRVVLIGNLTRDPELRSLPSGSSVCNFRVACNSTRRDAEGDFQEKPNFFDVSVFGERAENVSRYTRKGRRVAIDGRLDWREWETSDGQKRQTVSVIADTVMFLDSPGERDEGESGDQGPRDEIDQRSASELVGVGAGAEDDGLVF
jgi:single-strand DNA-binding protein